MPETTDIMFSLRELAEILVRKQGIHEGFWGISLNFNFAATMMAKNPTELYPTAIAQVAGIGLHKFEAESNIAVDAAKVNPRPKGGKPAPK